MAEVCYRACDCVSSIQLKVVTQYGRGLLSGLSFYLFNTSYRLSHSMAEVCYRGCHSIHSIQVTGCHTVWQRSAIGAVILSIQYKLQAVTQYGRGLLSGLSFCLFNTSYRLSHSMAEVCYRGCHSVYSIQVTGCHTVWQRSAIGAVILSIQYKLQAVTQYGKGKLKGNRTEEASRSYR